MGAPQSSPHSCRIPSVPRICLLLTPPHRPTSSTPPLRPINVVKTSVHAPPCLCCFAHSAHSGLTAASSVVSLCFSLSLTGPLSSIQRVVEMRSPSPSSDLTSTAESPGGAGNPAPGNEEEEDEPTAAQPGTVLPQHQCQVCSRRYERLDHLKRHVLSREEFCSPLSLPLPSSPLLSCPFLSHCTYHDVATWENMKPI